MRRLAASIRLVAAGVAICLRFVPFRATVLDALLLASAHQELDDCGNNPAETIVLKFPREPHLGIAMTSSGPISITRQIFAVASVASLFDPDIIAYDGPAECEQQANGGFGWDAIARASPIKLSSDRLLQVPNGSVDALGSGAVRNLGRLIVAGKDDVKLLGCHVVDFGAKLVQGKYNFFHMIEDASHDGIFHECDASIETDVSCLCRTAFTGCGNLSDDRVKLAVENLLVVPCQHSRQVSAHHSGLLAIEPLHAFLDPVVGIHVREGRCLRWDE
jgi:hypothetical protein